MNKFLIIILSIMGWIIIIYGLSYLDMPSISLSSEPTYITTEYYDFNGKLVHTSQQEITNGKPNASRVVYGSPELSYHTYDLYAHADTRIRYVLEFLRSDGYTYPKKIEGASNDWNCNLKFQTTFSDGGEQYYDLKAKEKMIHAVKTRNVSKCSQFFTGTHYSRDMELICRYTMAIYYEDKDLCGGNIDHPFYSGMKSTLAYYKCEDFIEVLDDSRYYFDEYDATIGEVYGALKLDTFAFSSFQDYLTYCDYNLHDFQSANSPPRYGGESSALEGTGIGSVFSKMHCIFC